MNINLANIDFAPGQGGGGVTPSGTITLSMNGTYDVTNYAQAEVSVSGTPTDYRYKKGTVPGLADLGWDADDIGYLEYNMPLYGWQSQVYAVSQDNKDLYGVVDEINYRNYAGDPDMVYLPKFSVTGDLIFSGFIYLRGLPLFDTSNMTNMYNMFSGCEKLKTVPPLDTSNVTDMTNMFAFCYELETVPLLDTSNVTNMYNMFATCNKLKTVPLFDTSNVTNMDYMFQNCVKLETVPLLDTSNVTRMNAMFYGCNVLKSIPAFDTSKVTDMSYMFQDCQYLEAIPAFDTSNVTNMNSMFGSCSMLKSIPALDTKKVTNMDSMFINVGDSVGYCDINGIDFSSMTSAPNYMFTYDVYYDKIYRLIVNGKIDFDCSSANGFINSLRMLDYDSVKSILQAMYRTTNNDPKTMVFSCSIYDGLGEIAQLVTDCGTKGWTVTGLNIYNSAYDMNYTGTSVVRFNPSNDPDLFGTNCVYIGNEFSNGSGKIMLSSSPTRLGDSLFEARNNLTGIDIPSTVEYIGYNTFTRCGFTSVTIPSSVLHIGSFCFYGCENLTSVTISGAPEIEQQAFWECHNLHTVTLESMTPPVITSSSVIWTNSLQEIRVPQAALADYQSSNWGAWYRSWIVGY